MEKPIIYQLLPRLWGNDSESRVCGGSLEENGTGKFSDIDSPALEYFKWLGCTHIWFTGVIRHSTKSASCGCFPSNPQFVKGEAGSPYAIVDYFDVNPYLASDPDRRMEEFEDIVRRTHEAGLKVIIDFVPNHVSRDYGKIEGGSGRTTLGDGDDTSVHWAHENDFFYYPGQGLTLPDTDAFLAECNALSSGDFSRTYSILPAWLVRSCKEKYGNSSPEEYRRYLAENERLLTPYQEYPAKATGNSYTPSPGVNDLQE